MMINVWDKDERTRKEHEGMNKNEKTETKQIKSVT